MITLRNEIFGGLIANDETGNIVQLNKEAYNIVEKYLTHKPINKDENIFLKNNDYFEIKNFKDVRIIKNKINKNCLSVPESVIIRITSKCNKHCPGCYENRENLDIDPKSFYKIIDEISQIGVFRVQIGGGEPLLNKNILKFLKYMRKKHLIVSVGTNGSLINDNFAKSIKKIGGIYFQISLNEPGNEKLEDVLNTIEKGMILKKYGIRHGYNLLLTHDNINNIEKIINISGKTCPAKIKLLRPKPCSNKLWFEKEEITVFDTEIIKKIKMILKNNNNNIDLDCSFNSLINKGKSIGCLGATRTMCISEKLCFVGCPFFMDYAEKINENSSILQIWTESENLKSTREKIRNKSGNLDSDGLRRNANCLLFEDDKKDVINKYKKNMLVLLENHEFLNKIVSDLKLGKIKKIKKELFKYNNYIAKLFEVQAVEILIENFDNQKQFMYFTSEESIKKIHCNMKILKTSNPLRIISVLIHEYVHIVQLKNNKYTPVSIGNENNFFKRYFENASEKEAYFIQYMLTDYIYMYILKKYNSREVKDIIAELIEKDKLRKNMMKNFTNF